MYTVEGKIILEDYQNANRLSRKPKGFSIILRVVTYLFIGIAAVYILFVALTSPNWATILPLFVFAGIIVFTLAYVPYRTKKVFEQQKELHYPFTMTIDETGLHTKNQIGESKRPWNMFVKWREDQHLIMFYHSDILFSMISKRYLSEEAIQFVHEQLKKNQIPEK
jgi:hypothetical protein